MVGPGARRRLVDARLALDPRRKAARLFPVHPDPSFRRRTEIYAHKVEGQIDTAYYILGPEMRGRLEEARPASSLPASIAMLAAALAGDIPARERERQHRLVYPGCCAGGHR